VKGALPPWEWYEAHLCEEFHCLPSELEGEDPQKIQQMVMLRAYARTKAQLDNAKSEGDVPQSAMADRVWQIQHDIMTERKKRKEIECG